MAANRIVEFGARQVFLRRLGPRWAKPLSRNGIFRIPSASVGPSGGLIFPELGTPIPEPNAIGLAFLKKIMRACDLHRRAGAVWTFEPDSALAEIGGIKIRVANEADIEVVHEVFGEKLYVFGMPGEFLVLDVGANIGASMLYFAKHYNAEVRGYELVPSTAEIAKRNIDLNPELASRMTLEAFGLGDKDLKLNLECDPNTRPSNSIFPSPGSAQPLSRSEQTVTETVEVRDVAPVLTEALNSLANRKLVLKLDAEGAEFGILRRLAARGLLQKIDLLLLEWHRIPGESPTEIPEMLTKAGFTWFSREHHDAPVGFITAFRA